jgi:hypothetical protein
MKGFIALISVLIISAVLMLLVVGESAPAWYARMDQLTAEWHIQAELLAESCAGVVQLKRIAQPDYGGNETITVAAASCKVTYTNRQFAVETSYHGAVAVLEL